MDDRRLPDLTPMSVTELYQGFDMGAGALTVHQSLLMLLMSDGELTIDELKELIADEIARIATDLQAIELEIAFKADGA